MSVSRTNQVLYFASLSLEQLQTAQGQTHAQIQEQTLFHLYSGFVSFCWELVDQYNLPPFDELSELLTRTELPAELYELSLLSKDEESWLSDLLSLYKRMLKQGLNQRVVDAMLITSGSDYQSLFANLLKRMEKTIQRMREHYQEH